MGKDAISALRDILATNWSKPPEPSIEDIADVDKGDAKRVRLLDTDVIRIFETAHNEAQPELVYDFVNEHVNITIDCRTVDSRERLSEIRDEVRRIIQAFRKGDNNNFDRLIYKTRTDLSDRSKKLFRYTIQVEVITFSLVAGADDPVVNPADGSVVGSNVYQTLDGDLTALAGLVPSDGVFIVGDGSSPGTWVAESGATARASLGLGTMATQASDNVSITGGSLSGISGLVSSITAGTGITGNATEGAITLNVGGLTVSELAANSIQLSNESFGDNDTSVMSSAAILDKIQSEISALVDSAPGALDTLNELAAAVNDDASFASTITTSIGTKLAKTSNLSDLANAGTARTNLGLGSLATLSSVAFSNIAGAAIQTSSEAFADNDTSLMTSAAVQDKILSFGFTTEAGDITGVAAGTGLSGGGSSGDVTLTIDMSEYSQVTPASGDSFLTLDSDGSTEQRTTVDALATLLAGTNISASNGVLSSTDTNTFRTVTAGGETLGASETLAFTAGSNVTITESSGAVTIASTQLSLLDEDNMASNSATQAASQQSVKAYVDAEVAGVIDSAPGALDTLNELAAAINDDSSFSSTVTTALGNRLRVDVNSQSLNSTQQGNALTNLGITASLAEINILNGGLSASDVPSLATSKVTSGTFADGRIAESNVTQHLAVGSGGGIGLSGKTFTLDIDGMTDINAALVDADLMIVDDGAGGTNRKATMSRLKTYMQSNLTFTTDTNTFRTVTAGGNTLGASETLAFTAGTGITIAESNGAVTINSSVSNTNTFRTVTAGGNTLGSSETLAFTAGSNVTITESAGAVTIASSNASLSSEEVQDIAGPLVATGGTKTFITVTYDDGNDNMDFVVPVKDEDNMTSNSATHLATQQSIKAYIDSKTASIVDSAPAALDTLNELAAALNDDASFSTTTATSLGNRLRIDDNQSLSSTQQAQGLTNLGITASLAEINILDGGLSASDIPSLATSKITSGTFANARISQGSVTQHQAALSVTESQISDLGSYITAVRSVTAGGNTLASNETLAFTAGSNITITESGGAVTITGASTGIQGSVSDTQVAFGNGSNITSNSGLTFSTANNFELLTVGDQYNGAIRVGTGSNTHPAYSFYATGWTDTGLRAGIDDNTNQRKGLIVTIEGDDQVHFHDGFIRPMTNNDYDLGSSTFKFKDAYFDGVVYADAINLAGTALGALATLDSVAAGQIDANAVDSSELKDGAVDESHLNATNSATDNHLLSYDSASGGFTWVAAGAGGENNQNAFSTISVSGQSDVVADGTTDTLTFAAGSNVTLTTNASSDTVTIASADTNTFRTVTAGGNTLGSAETLAFTAGSNVSISESSGAVTIASTDTNTTTTADVASALNANIGANFNIGTTASHKATFAGQVSASSLIISGSSSDTYVGTLSWLNPQADDRIWTLPDHSGTVLTSNDIDTEYIQDIVGAMFASNTETRISATYVDGGVAAGKINLVVDDMTANDNTFRTITAGGNTLGASETLAFTAGSNVTISESGGSVTIASTDTNTQLSLLDEDNFASNSATAAASQQSIKAYVDAEVSGLVDSAPGALNTLNELAAALGDDASFSTTTATSLGNRLRIDVSNQGLNSTQQGNALTNLGITASLAEINILDGGLSASDIPNLATSKITSGTFANGRISAGSVTQHQAALSITESQISDLGSYITAVRSVTAGGNTLATGETLAFTAGTGITIAESGGAVTITNSVSDTNTFRTVTAGGNTLASNETLAFTAGSNVTITESSGAVTIASTDTNTQYSAGSGIALSSTTFSVAAGNGLAQEASGLKLDDPANLSELNESTDATDDKVLLWDESASSWKYMTLDNLQDAIDTTASGGVGGSIANTQVAFGSGTNITGSSTFFYTDATNTLNIANGAAAGTLTSGSHDLILRNSAATGHSKITIAYDSSAAANSHIELETDGTGNVEIHKEGAVVFKLPNTIGSSGQILKVPSSGTTLEWAADTSTDTNTQNVFTSSFVDSSNDTLLRLTKSGASSGTQDIKFVAGSNIALTPSGTNLTIAATDTNTEYTAGTNISLSGTTFNVDDAFLINNGNDTTSGTITAGGFSTAGSITLGGHAFNDIDIGSEFVDADDHLMSSGAIKEKIESYGYTTNTGDITSVVAGTNLSGGATSGAATLNVSADPSFSTVTVATDIIHDGDANTKIGFTPDVITLGTGGATKLTANNSGIKIGSGATVEIINTSFSDNDTSLMTSQAIKEKIENYGYTTNTGDITAVVAGTGLSGGANSGSATLNVSGLTVSELAANSIQLSSESFADNDTSVMTSAAIADKIESYGFGTGGGDITAVVAGTGLSGGATSGSATLNVSGLTVSEIAAGSILVAGETFADNDTSLMTAAAINDRIESFSYTTNTGDITGVTAGTGLSGGGSSGGVTLNIDLKDEDNMASNSDTHAASQQSIKAYVDAEVAGIVDSAPGALNTLNELAAAINDDASFSSTITTSIGTKLAKSSNLSDLANAGTARTNLGLGTGAVLDTAAIADGGSGLATADQIHTFVTDFGYTTNTGDITGVTAGTGLSGGGSSGGVTLNVSGLTVSELAANSIQLSSESFANNDTSLMTSAAIEDKILSYSYTTNTGDITSVVAGTGLSGGATSGAATLNVSGLTVSELAANSIQLSNESFADNDTSLMTSAAIQDKILSYSYTTNTGDITAVVAGTGLSGGATSGSATLNVSGLTVSELAANSLQISSESFANNDTSLMTSAAIEDKIESYNYTTNTGDITGVDLTVTSPITIASETNTTSGSYSATLGLDDPANLTELTESSDATDDKILLWDEDAGSWKYMTLDNLQDSIDTTASGGASDLDGLSDVSYSSGDLTITSLDTLVVGGFTIDSSGDLTFDAAGDQIYFKDEGSTRFQFNLDSTPEIDVTGNFTIDGSGDISFDAGSPTWRFKSAETEHFRISMISSGDIILSNTVQDKDIYIRGNDGGVTTDFLVFDSSAAGQATFSGNLVIPGEIQHSGDTNNSIAFGTDTQTFETSGSTRLDISDSGVRLGGANSRVTTILDEDNMATNSATALATQQSIKAYVDANAGGISNVVEDTSPQLGGDLDTNGHDIIIDDGKGIYADAISNGRELLLFQHTADGASGQQANAYLQVWNGISDHADGTLFGNDVVNTDTPNVGRMTGPGIEATGDSTDVGMSFRTKGLGQFTFFQDETSANGSPVINLVRYVDDNQVADDDILGQIKWMGGQSSMLTPFLHDLRTYARIEANLVDTTSNTTDANLMFSTMVANTNTDYLEVGTNKTNDTSAGVRAYTGSMVTYSGTGTTALSRDTHAGAYVRATGAGTFTLWDSPKTGDQVVVISDHGGTTTIDGHGNDTINGAANTTITTQYNAKTFIATSSSTWIALG